MYQTPKRLAALLFLLVMAVSCLNLTAFAAESDGVLAEVTANTIRGSADTDRFSTLKEYIDEDLTVPGNPVEYTGAAVISASAGSLDASNAKITVAPGDGYYQDDLIFNGSAAENITVNANGTLSFVMNTGDLTWNNHGFPVEEGGLEFSAQGGDLNGQYHIRLAINGLTCGGKPVDEVIVMVYIYIYGREFSDMASPQNPGSAYWGTGNLGQAVLPYAEKIENPAPQQAGDEPVWNWAIRNWGETEGYTETLPVLCDKATDDFYVTWPANADASRLTADDVTIKLISEYGEELVLKAGGDEKKVIAGHPGTDETREVPAGDYAVYASQGETQISINKVHWLAYPVYSRLTIEIDTSKVNGYDKSVVHEENIASVYLYSTQTGGGLDLQDTTVTVVTYYGIANKVDADDFYKYSGMYSYWAYGGSQGGPGGPGGGGPGGGPGGGNSGGGMMMPQGPQGDLFLVMNEDGTVKYVTDDSSDPAIIMDSVKPADWAGHSYFYTNYSSNQTMDVEYEGKTYTFTLKQPNMLNQLSSPSTDIKCLPGYLPTIGGHYSDRMNAGWAFFLRDLEDTAWLVTDKGIPFKDISLYSGHEYEFAAWAYEKGIINGTSATTFAGDSILTRAQAVTMLWRAAGCPEMTGTENPFRDVPAGMWYYNAVLWAVKEGITSGTSEVMFSPEDTLTHEQMITFIYRYAEKVGTAAAADMAAAAAWAKESGIANVENSPNGACSRYQAVAYLYRYMGS